MLREQEGRPQTERPYANLAEPSETPKIAVSDAQEVTAQTGSAELSRTEHSLSSQAKVTHSNDEKTCSERWAAALQELVGLCNVPQNELARSIMEVAARGGYSSPCDVLEIRLRWERAFRFQYGFVRKEHQAP